MYHLLFLNGFLHQFWDWLNAWDTYIFLQLNSVYTNSFFDHVLPIWRNANTWLPLYIFLIVFAVTNFKSKSFFWIVGAVLTLVLTDQISSSLIKPFFERPRPCNDPNLMSQVRLLLGHCSGGYSFTSSHATNHFGFAVYIATTLKPLIKKWRYAFYFWAASICYAQIYVGVHYPLDVFFGALLGIGIAILTTYFFQVKIGYLTTE